MNKVADKLQFLIHRQLDVRLSRLINDQIDDEVFTQLDNWTVFDVASQIREQLYNIITTRD